MSLKNKRILITAGPTWVPIDKVRVISNIATGETGVLLAGKLQGLGANVTLMLGPVINVAFRGSVSLGPRRNTEAKTTFGIGVRCLNKKIRLLRFKFFDELKTIINRELRTRKYDAIIHSAAISDFRPQQYLKSKLSSDKIYNLKLIPLPKIIRDIRCLTPEAKLIMFKLEEDISDKTLIKRARESAVVYRADLVIANRIYPAYKAFILSKDNIYSQVNSKKELVKELVNLLQ